MRFEKSRKYIEGKLKRRADGSLESQNNDVLSTKPKEHNRISPQDTQKLREFPKDDDNAIGDVWEEQIRLKDDAKRHELEYEIAKKLTKELRQKMRDSKESVGDDASFSDILSPETKNVVHKLKSSTTKAKNLANNALYLASNRLKTIKLVAKIAINKIDNSKYRQYKWVIPVPVIAVVILGGIGISKIQRDSNITDVKSANTNNIDRDIPLNVTPEFDVLLPNGKKIEQLGGFAKISPQGSAPAYAYLDSIDGINIKITQQQIPDKLKVNTEVELGKLANDFNATRSIQIDETLTYVGKSEKGPQTVIFIKNGLLVFITAEIEISDVGWVQYVSQLN